MPIRILVGSVFANDTKIQQHWLDLQLQYLKETTGPFEHIACITGDKTTDYFDKRTTTITVNGNADTSGGIHAIGLNAIADYFRKHRDEFDAFLILDSDAFPIRKNWASMLSPKMRSRRKEIAAPYRLENLETRSHVCSMYILQQALPFIHFEIATTGKDILDNIECDVCIPEYEGRRRELVYPLLRSNRHNRDPFYCAIYYDTFYHHSCGSRINGVPRGRRFYWKGIKDNDNNPNILMMDLFKNPTKFINQLAGWSPNLYADVDPIIVQDRMNQDGQVTLHPID